MDHFSFKELQNRIDECVNWMDYLNFPYSKKLLNEVKKSPKLETIILLFEYCPYINITWVLYGTGDMIEFQVERKESKWIQVFKKQRRLSALLKKYCIKLFKYREL